MRVGYVCVTNLISEKNIDKLNLKLDDKVNKLDLGILGGNRIKLFENMSSKSFKEELQYKEVSSHGICDDDYDYDDDKDDDDDDEGEKEVKEEVKNKENAIGNLNRI